MGDIARATISCAHFPVRTEKGGGQRSCGLCPACIFRRVALNAADIHEDADRYQYDLFDPQRTIPPKKMNYLIAFLNQIDSLSETDQGRLPVSISKNLRQTKLIERGEPLDEFVNLYRRYRNEWIAFVIQAKSNGCEWTRFIDLPSRAA